MPPRAVLSIAMSSNSTGADAVWRELTTVSTDAEARLVEGWLENEGIGCQLESLFFTQEPVQFGLLGGVRVHVLSDDLERAEELLLRLQNEAVEDPDPEAGAAANESAGASGEEDGGS